MKKFLDWRIIISAALVFSILFFTCKKTKKNDTQSSSTSTGGYSTGYSTGGGSTPVEVSMQNNSFSPSSLSVAKGTTVTWINKDSNTHTVTSSDKVFESSDMYGGANYSYTFNTTGTYSYYCKYHSSMGMKGVIIVK